MESREPAAGQQQQQGLSMEQVQDALGVCLDVCNGDQSAALSKTDQFGIGKLVLRQIVKGQLRLVAAPQGQQAAQAAPEATAQPADDPAAVGNRSQRRAAASVGRKKKSKRKTSKKS